jgi:hypothetical protein
MIPTETPYKVLKYLVKLSDEKVLQKNYETETLMLHFVERNYLTSPKDSPNKFFKTKEFEEPFKEEIFPSFQKYNSFIKKFQIENLENHYSIQEFEALIEIEKDKEQIHNKDFSFQTILTQYFGSSKHRKADSILSEAIKIILGIEFFPEEIKDQQFISILYPKSETRFIVLCENKNRLIIQRHGFIEFWYAGGKNTKQLQFIPKPNHPIFYLFDWDFDGLNIYIEIKQKYFPTLTAFIPTNFEKLMEKQEEVKEHHSKWKNDGFLHLLNNKEKLVAKTLLQSDSIIEEQRVLLNEENLISNGIK